MSKNIVHYILPLMAVMSSASCAHHEIPYGLPGADVQRADRFLYGRPGVFVYFIEHSDSELLGRPTEVKNKKRVQYIKEQFRMNPSLAPPECLGEIELIDWGDTQGRGSIASFHCFRKGES